MEEHDFVYYRIFPQLDEVDKKPAASSSSVKERLEELKTECLGVACPVVDGYVWQHEPFNLRVCSSLDDYLSSGNSSKGNVSCEEWESERTVSELTSVDAFVPHLAGKVKFGDNLEDEWLVVYLLLEISRRMSSVSITVRDSDGEFLLIESAYFIPNWLKPENSHNRIYIRQGAVHIVPFPRGTPRSRKSSGTTTLRNSLKVLADGVTDTRASEEVQDVIRERIAGYPEKAKKSMHGVRCKVPLPVAQILTHEPQLIALAVESFYTRDIDSMKAASQMEIFSSKCKDGNVNLVDTLVRMSRPMYAQLVQQVFQAPRNYPMPPLNSPGFKEAEIGMKIAVGFEMMYWERSSSEHVDALAVEELGDQAEGLKEQVPAKTKDVPMNDVAWKNYRASLEQSGYFRGLLDGSREHRELLQAAVVQYRSTNLFSRASMALNAPAKKIDELLSMPHSVKDFSNAGSSDDDSWLYDGEEDLTSVMLERQKEMDAYESKQEKLNSAKKSSAKARNLTSEELELVHATEVVKNVQSFVNKISSFEGAEIPDKDSDGNFGDDEEVSLDMTRLLKEMESVFDPKEISDMLSDGLGDEDTDASSDLDPDDSISGSEDDMESADTEIAELENTLSSIGALHSTDKGKNEDVAFSDEYSNLLDNELKSSSLAKSFATGKAVVSNDSTKVEDTSAPGPNSEMAEPEPVSIGTAELGPDDGDDNDLVEVDVNLVESLLRSYMFQQGMPGPASNLLGAMGVELPDNSDQRPGSYDKLKK